MSKGGRWSVANEITKLNANAQVHSPALAHQESKVTHHPQFFFNDVLIAIKIEDTLFNVHKYQLTKSEAFSDMFSMPKPESHEPEEGSSPEYPIVIDDVSASDFTALLTVLYASHFSDNHPAPEASLLIPTYRLANLFNFSDLLAHLLRVAEKKLNDVDKITFAREFDVKEWIAPAHIRLCKRDTGLSADEANKLGVNSVLMIWRMREQQHRSRSITVTPGKYYCSACTGLAGGVTGHCNNCRNHSGSLWQSEGTGTIEVRTSNNGAELEAEVKKWVEGGCIVKD